MGKWIKHSRKGGKTPVRPLVSIRREAIAFNAHFVATAGLEQKTRVSVFIDPEPFRLGFNFHDYSTDEDSYALSRDGGGRGRGRSIQTTALMRENLWLAAIAKEPDQRLRRFEPQWISADSLWVISICPPFENRVSDRSDIPSNVQGIYRYKRENEIVYIGRGQVRSRTQAQGRQDWDFETIEYSVVPDESEQKKWEAFWLDRFVEQHGKLPIYNRIGGEQLKTEGGQQPAERVK
jgi:hypothetical protein